MQYSSGPVERARSEEMKAGKEWAEVGYLC